MWWKRIGELTTGHVYSYFCVLPGGYSPRFVMKDGVEPMPCPSRSACFQENAIQLATCVPDGVEHVPPGLPLPVDRLLDLLVERLLQETGATSGDTQGNTPQ